MTKQYHGLQTHFDPPLFYRLHKLILCSLGVRGEERSGALAKAQQVQSEERPTLGERVQILSPKADAASEPVEQNHRGFVFNTVAAKGQGPQHVVVGDGDELFGKGSADAWEEKEKEKKPVLQLIGR